MKRRILITGATGRVGGATIRELQRRGVKTVVAGVRDLDRARTTIADDIELRHLDLDNASTLPDALAGIDAALLITGYSVDMLVQSQRFLHAAKHAGLKHIVHLGASGNPTTEVAHWGWHRYVEALIEQLGFVYTHLRPEAYMQNIADFGWLNGNTLTSYIGDARWSWVDVEDVGVAAAAALADPVRFRNSVVPLGYDAKSLHEIATILSARTGEPMSVECRDPSVFLAGAVAAGNDAAYMSCVARQFALNAANAIADADRTFDNAEEVLGRAPTTWDDFADRLVDSGSARS